MVLQFRSDLNGGLQQSTWLYEFGVFLVDPDGEEVMALYGTLGDYHHCPGEYANGRRMRPVPHLDGRRRGRALLRSYRTDKSPLRSGADHQSERSASMNGSVNVPGVSGADLARIESKANKAASDASAALTAASAAQTAASKAQTAADAALKAVEGFAFTINTIPSQNGTLTYNGSEQSPTWNSFNPDALTLGGVTKGTDAGE